MSLTSSSRTGDNGFLYLEELSLDIFINESSILIADLMEATGIPICRTMQSLPIPVQSQRFKLIYWIFPINAIQMPYSIHSCGPRDPGSIRAH